MHKKEMQIRQSIRSAQVNEMKASIRQNLVDAYERGLRCQQYCRVVQQCMRKSDINIFFEMFSSTNEEMVVCLTDEIVLRCYQYLAQNMEDLKCLILLQSVVEKHFSKIFSNYQMVEFNECVVEKMYVCVNRLVQKIKNNQIDYNGGLSCGLNYYLRILKNFYAKQNGVRANEMLFINKTQYIADYVIPWTDCLLINKTYLFILAKITMQKQLIQCYEKALYVFISDLRLVHTLMSNISNNQDESNIYSYNILRSLLENLPLTQPFVKNIISEFLVIINRIFKQYQKRLNGTSHASLIQGLKSLDRLLIIIQRNNTVLQKNCYLFQGQYFQMLLSLLIVQSDPNRQILYSVLQKSIQIVQSNGKSIFTYINRKQLDKLTFDLANDRNNRILSLTIRIIIKLLRSQSLSKDFFQQLIHYFLDHNIVQVLQILQFHQNREISLYAIEMLQNEFKEQDYGEDGSRQDEDRYWGQ